MGRSALALGSAVDLLEAEDGRPPEGRDWVLPSIEMLTIVPEPPVTSSRANHEANIRIIEDKLNSFGIPATVIATNTGPVVTQYEIALETGLRVNKVTALADDIALNLRVPSVRMVSRVLPRFCRAPAEQQEGSKSDGSSAGENWQ